HLAFPGVHAGSDLDPEATNRFVRQTSPVQVAGTSARARWLQDTRHFGDAASWKENEVEQVSFTQMQNGTTEDWALLERFEEEFNAGLPDRILDAVDKL